MIGNPTADRHARSFMSLPTKATSRKERPSSLAVSVRIASLSSHPWKHLIASFRLRCWTTAFVSVDTITVSIPSLVSSRSPSPSPRQHRTDSRPSSDTYTVLSVKTPSKSKATRRTARIFAASARVGLRGRELVDWADGVLVRLPRLARTRIDESQRRVRINRSLGRQMRVQLNRFIALEWLPKGAADY